MADVTVKQVDDMEAIFYGSFKRAGASGILTYHALDAARLLNG